MVIWACHALVFNIIVILYIKKNNRLRFSFLSRVFFLNSVRSSLLYASSYLRRRFGTNAMQLWPDERCIVVPDHPRKLLDRIYGSDWPLLPGLCVWCSETMWPPQDSDKKRKEAMSHRLDHALKETSSESLDENEVQTYYIFKRLLAITVNSDNFFLVLNSCFFTFDTCNCT